LLLLLAIAALIQAVAVVPAPAFSLMAFAPEEIPVGQGRRYNRPQLPTFRALRSSDGKCDIMPAKQYGAIAAVAFAQITH
jgi:hypothetical protein